MTDIRDTLEERGKLYGAFIEQARIANALKQALWHVGSWHKLDADMQLALEMIVVKVARVLNGKPDHVDNWDDIAGYATLVADRLREAKDEARS